MLAIPALLGEHVTGPYEGHPKPPLEVVVVTRVYIGKMNNLAMLSEINIEPGCRICIREKGR